MTNSQGNAGSVVQADDLTADRDGGGAGLRTLLDLASGGLVRHLVDLPAGSRLERTAGGGGDLWFVISGHGQLRLDHSDVPLEPDRGLWIPAGCTPVASADETGDLVLDIVTLPVSESGSTGEPSIIVRDWSDCAVEVTGDRQFWVLFGPGFGCSVATQFVGEIPPGRAPEHSHPYDETVMVLAGEGVVHIDGGTHQLRPGTCTHLPPGLPHCLENTGSAMLRVLGVFHPADSPAAKLSS